MNLKDKHNFYFLGIGGIGMSALARYFKAAGKFVAGYDLTESPLTKLLESEGIPVHYEDNVDLIAEQIKADKDSLIIYTPAVPSGHKELNYLLENGYAVKKRSQVLGDITAGAYTIAVAGTHGKTTTSSLIAHLLYAANKDISAFLGGIATNYNTNLLIGKNIESPVVVEADEFDRSFLTLHPNLAIITSMDADHLDIYGESAELERSFRDFAGNLNINGKLFYKKGLPLEEDNRHYSYSITEKADVMGTNVRIENAQYYFDLSLNGKEIKDLQLGIPGWHNVENAVAASAIALEMGLTDDELRAGLKSFKGVKRRFEYIINTDNMVFIDDYAHHPTELTASINSVKSLYPDQKITGIFQPHLYSRTRDFADGFAESLSLLDELILLDIYPARELPMEGVTSEMILEKVTLTNKQVCSKHHLVALMKNKKPEVLVTLGAGDIDRLVQPLKELYS